MKKLIWKLRYKNGAYTLQYNWRFVIPFFIALSPIIFLLYVFKLAYDLFWSPFQVDEKTIEWPTYNRALSKKDKEMIFRILISK